MVFEILSHQPANRPIPKKSDKKVVPSKTSIISLRNMIQLVATATVATPIPPAPSVNPENVNISETAQNLFSKLESFFGALYDASFFTKFCSGQGVLETIQIIDALVTTRQIDDEDRAYIFIPGTKEDRKTSINEVINFGTDPFITFYWKPLRGNNATEIEDSIKEIATDFEISILNSHEHGQGFWSSDLRLWRINDSFYAENPHLAPDHGDGYYDSALEESEEW